MITRWALLLAMAGCCLISPAPAAGGNPEKTRQLIAVLQSEAAFFDQARACQQLGEIGTAEAVPALAALLANDHLSAYARSGLEGIPDPSAAAALRAATRTLKGPLLAGVVNSLGVLRDEQAVDILRRLAVDPASGAAKEALLALGRMATGECLPILRQTLADESEVVRADAAAACLLAAEKQWADGHGETATMLYDLVRQAKVPAAFRAGATRGAILSRKTNGVVFLMAQLRSEDHVIRKAALLTLREMPGEALASALNAEMKTAAPDLQVQLLTAMVDCHNPQSFPVIQAQADSEDSEIRKTALTVLGKIGRPADADVLLKALAHQRSPEESAVALSGLGRLEGVAVDDSILQALASATDPDLRIKLIWLLEGRRVSKAVEELLRQAADPEPKVNVAALGALKSLAGPKELPALIALTKASQDDTVRDTAEKTVVGFCLRTDLTESGGEAVLAELIRATAPVEKNSWVRILASLGYAQALPAMIATLSDANEAVAVNTIEQLGRWPDPAPLEALFVVVDAGANPGRQRRALKSAIQLASTAAEEHQRPEAMVVGWLRRAHQSAPAIEDKRLIVSALGRLPQIESLRLLAPYLDDPGLQNEAAQAIVQIAPALAKSDPASDLRESLVKISATAKSPDLRNQAAQLASLMPATIRPALLFDGRSLAGWEGNTNVWRVQDGVIVGGSMNGNPRNEFLATVRSYTNFLLRLEYKLVGTEGFVNGGVQFRSVRVKQPPNEMSGYQADIGAGYSGCLYDESRRNAFLVRTPDEQIKRLEKPGEWNRYEVRSTGPRIQIRLNGEPTVDYTETDAAIPRGGLIGLQIHGGCKAEIAFRNLTIEEITP